MPVMPFLAAGPPLYKEDCCARFVNTPNRMATRLVQESTAKKLNFLRVFPLFSCTLTHPPCAQSNYKGSPGYVEDERGSIERKLP